MSQTIDTIFKITASVVGANALKEFSKDIERSSTSTQNLSRSLQRGALLLKAFAASQVVVGLKGMVTSAIELGDQINDISQKTGVAVETLGRLKGAAENSGTSLDAVSGAMIKLNRAIIDAQDGTGKTAAAFSQLGIEVRNGSGELKDAERLFLELSDKFKGTEDGAGKTAAAIALLGKSGADMIPLLNMGKEEILSLGLAIGPEFAAQSDAFNDNMGKIRMRFTQLSVDIASAVLPGLVSISEGFEKNNVAVDTLIVMIKGLQVSFVGLQTFGATAVNAVSLAFAQLSVSVSTAYEKMKAFVTMDSEGYKAANDRQGAMQKSVFDEYVKNQLEDQRNAKATIDEIIGSNFGSGSAYKPKSGAVTAQPAKPSLVFNPDAASKSASEFDKAAKAADDWLAKQREGIITLQEEARYLGMTSVEVSKLKDARQVETEIAEKARNMSVSQSEAFKTQAAEITRARQAVLQYNYDQSRTFGAGAQEFFASYREQVTNTADQIKTVLSNAFKGAEDALVEFTTTGKLNFKSFANSIIQDLIRMQIRKSIIAPVSDFLGSLSFFGGATKSAMGNIMTGDGPMPLKKYATGGIARSPQLSIFGEGSQPEAYVPLPDGRTIPVTMKGGQSGVGQINVVVNIDKSGGGQESVEAEQRKSTTFGRQLAASIKAQILEEQRPGGLLSK